MSNINLNLAKHQEKIYVNKDLYGEDKVIYIDTTDDGILLRARDSIRRMTAAMHLIRQAEADLSSRERKGEDVTEERLDEREKTEKLIRDQIDYIFGYPVSEVVFGSTSVVAPYEDTTYVEAFLNAIMPVIAEKLQEACEASNKRVAAYTEKYDKK